MVIDPSCRWRSWGLWAGGLAGKIDIIYNFFNLFIYLTRNLSQSVRQSKSVTITAREWYYCDYLP